MSYSFTFNTSKNATSNRPMSHIFALVNVTLLPSLLQCIVICRINVSGL
jgi:hypothetical protein